MKKSRLLGTVCIAIYAICISNSANAALIGLSTDALSPGTTSAVFDINPSTGLATQLVTTNQTSFVGATFLDGVLYGSDVAVDVSLKFGTIDPYTGVFTTVNDQDGSANWHGLASDETADLVYTIDFDDGYKLKSITSTGSITTIGTGTGISGSGMAYDDGNNILYATGSNSLYSVDTALGTSTLIGAFGISLATIGLAYDEINGILYANSGGTGSLYTISTVTGAVTLIGTNGVSMIDGLAWITEVPPPAVPIPAAFWLFGSGLLGLMGIARRKKSA